MPHLGAPELLIILVIVVLLFGVGRISEIGGALGKGVKEFRSASKEIEGAVDDLKEDDKPTKKSTPEAQPEEIAAEDTTDSDDDEAAEEEAAEEDDA